MMELAEKDFKIAILNMLKDFKNQYNDKENVKHKNNKKEYLKKNYKICEMKYHCVCLSAHYILQKKRSVNL